MIKHYNLDNCPNNLSGIYLITFPNGKIYIGLSNNIKRRIKEHNTESRQALLYKVIQKYGKIFEFDVLEEIDSINRELLLKKEEEYIAKYKSNQKEFGYNLTPGGNTYMKYYNPNALFSEADLENIKEELLNSSLSELEIAQNYNCSQDTIIRINTGKYYFNNKWNYPIRKNKKFQNGEKNPNALLRDNQYNEIISLLKNSSLSMKEIAQQFNCSSSLISSINRGVTRKQKNIEYPIRKNKITKNYLKLSERDIDIIISLLQDRDLTMEEIGKQFNCSRDTIGNINNGISYHRNNINYPIRLRSKKK